MALSHSPQMVRSGLIVYLDSLNPKSYPGTGTTWYDLSGNNNHGTLTGFTGPSAGSTSGFDTNTKHMMFDRHSGAEDGVANNRVTINNSDSLDGCVVTTGMTVSFWLKVTTYTCTAMTKWSDSWEIFYCSDLHWRTNGTGGNTTNSGLAVSTNLNKFHLITATHSGTERKFYINGDLYYTNSNTVTSQNLTNPVSIGAYDNGNFATIGAIPTYLLYNRVLSASEVKQNFEALRGRYDV
jgi:hypothetical protein